MDLLSLVIPLIIFGVIWYLVDRFVPMAPPVKTVLTIVLVLVLILWLLQGLGVGGVPSLRLRH